MFFHEFDGESLCEKERDFMSLLGNGEIVVLRNVKEIRKFRASLVEYAGKISPHGQGAIEVEAFYKRGTIPSVKTIYGLALAIKQVRADRFLSRCLAPLVKRMAFAGQD